MRIRAPDPSCFERGDEARVKTDRPLGEGCSAGLDLPPGSDVFEEAFIPLELLDNLIDVHRTPVRLYKRPSEPLRAVDLPSLDPLGDEAAQDEEAGAHDQHEASRLESGERALSPADIQDEGDEAPCREDQSGEDQREDASNGEGGIRNRPALTPRLLN